MATADNYNFIRDGERITFVVGGPMTAGDPVLVGGTIPAVCLHDAADAGDEMVANRCGVYRFAKDTAEALAIGDECWVDVADSNKMKKAGIATKRVFCIVMKDALEADPAVEALLAVPGLTR